MNARAVICARGARGIGEGPPDVARAAGAILENDAADWLPADWSPADGLGP